MLEAEPREILEDRPLELDARALAIVILDAQQDLAVAIARRAPDVERVDDVAEVQITGGRRGKPCQHVQSQDSLSRRSEAKADRSIA